MYSPVSGLDDSKNWTDADLSREKARTLVGSIVYLVLIMIIGVIGNILVLIIFYFRFTSSTHRCFILTLAIYDLLACAVGAPWIISESFFAFHYHDAISCKIFRFVLYYTCVASSLTLVLIAIERCRKICTPFKTQFTVPMAKRAIYVVVFGISSISSSPALVLYGNKTISTGYKNATGTKCFITDHFSETEWPKYFNVYLLALAFLSTAIMAVSYIRIARTVSKMGKDRITKRIKKKETEQCNSRTDHSLEKSDDDIIESDSQFPPQNGAQLQPPRASRAMELRGQLIVQNSIDSNTSDGSKKSKSRLREKSSKWASKVMKRLSSSTSSGRQTLRITKMLTFVTIAFVISYLPHLTLMLWSMFVSKEDEDTLPKDNLYQIVFYSFLLNNLVNPFIYATMDEKFKTELKKILKCEC
ncbi:G-protein coupled receptor 84-like [Dreissena polymorpha]|uniref:G-protein coupled receptors family 1 profile domain-containing protein n=1 Tax=Dreissena polymorpha TaxID=45954 RepID=A0A9D4JXR8_DREPO|nr:G-protein coupled receptor 84-like [Dreissena polymorpha]KAH3824392.1 hypothetical protein DPMN_126228 [Dreissena polymorpha]